ncbi:P-loop containing nucleoside triphosphate hydrolase protein [Russula dissimulans]|nr:P-loop containing nucleoside triphosphate hydrolase protein [Russula dissimulans]
MAYDMLRKDNMKPGSVTHETKTRWDPKRQRMVASSQRYANRIQDSQRVKFTLTHSSSNKFVLAGGISNVRGKSGHIEVEPYLEGKEIVSITTHGKDGPTQAEQDRTLSLLSVLQGTSHLLENHWMKALWQPSQPASWPDCFFSPDSPTIEIDQHPESPLNDSQISAIADMLSSSPISLVQGPPGTGKTTVIARYVLSAIQAEQKGIWLMAQSNVAVKNIAEKLAKVGFFNFKLLVSRNFHFEWNEHLYQKIEKNIIVSDKLPKPGALKKVLQGSQVILCTLSMISNPRLQDLGLTREVPIIKVIIDEASQIEVGQYVPLFKTFGKTLRKICFIGDDKQLPPHGQDDLGNLQSIFELDHLRDTLSFLNTQYRMPPQIGNFISEHVYDGKLKSNPSHVIPSSVVACRFVDVNGSEQLDSDGKSSFNQKEVEAIVLLARHLQEENTSYRIITPYDAQRNKLERALEDEDLKWQDKCFNVDSFQGPSVSPSSRPSTCRTPESLICI